MKAKYEDFLEKYPSYKKQAERPEFRRLFDEMNTEPMLLEMLKSVWRNRPALEGVVETVEKRCQEYGIVLAGKSGEQARKAIGALCATCLVPFGYVPEKSKAVKGAQYFTAAATYTEGAPKTREARLHIVDLETE